MSRSYIIAIALTLAIAAWMAGGYLLGGLEPETGETGKSAATEKAPMTVSVRTQDARKVEQQVISQGQAEPNRSVTVRAETAGQVSEILADEGEKVTAGNVIARLKPGDRAAKMTRSKARVGEQERAYEAAKSLQGKGYQSERRADEAFSALQTAKAELEEARVDLEHLEIKAPFEGTILNSHVELGAYVAVNGEVAMIVDNDPLVVSVRIAQQDISNIRTGLPAKVSFATGQKRDGKVRFVAARADDSTRTFRVEIEVPNPDDAIPSGISTEAVIPTGTVMAHFISPAALSLDEDGDLGVKTVDDRNKVAFHAAEIVRSEADGVWIKGLEAHARIITLGHGFVRVGDEVRVAEEQSAPAPGAAAKKRAVLSASEADAPKARP